MYKDIVFSWRSRVTQIGMGIAIIGIFLFPLPGILTVVGYFFAQRTTRSKEEVKKLLLVGSLILFIFGLIINNRVELSQSILGLFSLFYHTLFKQEGGFTEFLVAARSDPQHIFLPLFRQWLLGINLFGWGMGALLISSALAVQKSSAEILMDETIKDETEKDDAMERRGGIHFEDKGHVGAFGMTGSGKTSTVLHYVERAIKAEQFTVVIDGKGGTDDYDLNVVTEKLAKKHNRKLYVINQSDIEQTMAYNPFRDITETELKDLLSSLTEWSEEHYRTQALTYWQIMGRVLREVDIPFSFQSIIDYSDPNVFKALVKDAGENNKITEQLRKRANSVIAANRETVIAAIGRLAIFNDGDGRHLFKEDGFNLRQAYKEKAVVVVYLNEFKYSDFARSLGKLVVAEYKLFLSVKNNAGDKSEDLLVMDELGVYVEDNYEGLLNRTRSYHVKTIICMQVIADIVKVNESLLKQLLGNLSNFLIMRTDDDTANEVAKFIGTEKSVKRTSRSNEQGNTGENSNNVADGFVLNPNKIKNLADLEGYYYSHHRAAQPAKFYTTFVNVDEEDEPTNDEQEEKVQEKPEKIVLSKKAKNQKKPEKIVLSKKKK